MVLSCDPSAKDLLHRKPRPDCDPADIIMAVLFFSDFFIFSNTKGILNINMYRKGFLCLTFINHLQTQKNKKKTSRQTMLWSNDCPSIVLSGVLYSDRYISQIFSLNLLILYNILLILRISSSRQKFTFLYWCHIFFLVNIYDIYYISLSLNSFCMFYGSKFFYGLMNY